MILFLNRVLKVYLTLGKTYGTWISPIISGILIGILRLIVGIGMILDNLFWPSLYKRKLTNTEFSAKTTLCLPLHQSLTDNDMNKIIDRIRSWK